jgi:hypothetical protein
MTQSVGKHARPRSWLTHVHRLNLAPATVIWAGLELLVLGNPSLYFPGRRVDAGLESHIGVPVGFLLGGRVAWAETPNVQIKSAERCSTPVRRTYMKPRSPPCLGHRPGGVGTEPDGCA